MTTINVLPISKILKIILVFITLCQGHKKVADTNTMPILYKFDDYRECINQYESTQSYPAKYSMVLVKIQPNNDSPIWQQMQKMNESKFKYRHDYIFRGVCLERCKNVVKSNNNYNDYIHNGLLINEQTQVFQTIFNTSLDRIVRYEYHRNINKCINDEYMKMYNLSTKTSVIYALDPQQSKPKDTLFYIIIILFIVIILLNIISSIYDAKLKSTKLKSEDNDIYYEVKHKDKVNRYLTAFSLYRNYKRLISPNKSDIGYDLAFLDGFRVVLGSVIFDVHLFFIQFIHLENSEYIEYLYEQWWFRLTLPCLMAIELFLMLSGLLLFVKFEKGQYITPRSSLMDCVKVFVRLMISRYLRYLPSLIFVVIFTANIKYYENGPFTRFLFDSHCVPCRERWWYHIFMFINFKMKSLCLPQTWYIAVEFQLYGFFLLILIIMAKYPNTKTSLLFGVAILAAAINFGVNYGLKLDPIMLLVPESYRYLYFKDVKTAEYLYFSSYSNINSFLLGIKCGLIYMRYIRKNPYNKQKLGKLLKYTPYLGWPCILAILYLGSTIMEQTETTIWTAAYGLLHRHVGFAIIATIVILRGFCFGGGIFKILPLRILSRISYQSYLWHLTLLFYLFAFYEKPLNVNLYVIIFIGIFIYVCTNVIAFVMTLFVEYPFAEIITTIDIENKLRPVYSSSNQSLTNNKFI